MFFLVRLLCSKTSFLNATCNHTMKHVCQQLHCAVWTKLKLLGVSIAIKADKTSAPTGWYSQHGIYTTRSDCVDKVQNLKFWNWGWKNTTAHNSPTEKLLSIGSVLYYSILVEMRGSAPSNQNRCLMTFIMISGIITENRQKSRTKSKKPDTK